MGERGRGGDDLRCGAVEEREEFGPSRRGGLPGEGDGGFRVITEGNGERRVPGPGGGDHLGVTEFSHAAQFGEERSDAGEAGDVRFGVRSAHLGFVDRSEEDEADAGAGGGVDVSSTDGVDELCAWPGVVEVADVVSPEDTEGDLKSLITEGLKWRCCPAEQVGCEETLGEEDVHARTGLVLAVGCLTCEAEVGEGFDEAMDAGGLESKWACEFADTNRVWRYGDGLEASHPVDQALVRLGG
jgi:hypothetical protein